MKAIQIRSQEGQGLVEYALILVLVAVVVIGVLIILGPQVAGAYEQVAAVLGGGASGLSSEEAEALCRVHLPHAPNTYANCMAAEGY